MPAPLPSRCSERPLMLEEAGAVTRVMAANELATRKDQRNQGLAQALRTGALDLYRHVGMEVESTWIHRATRP